MRLLLILIWFVPFSLKAQSSSLPLNFNSYAIGLCVTAEESLILTTRAGEVGFANSLKSDWRRADPKLTEEYSKPLIDQANFFNKDTGFLSGFIQGQHSMYDIIYHTSDGGNMWKAINFGLDGWVDCAANLDNGEAWLSVAGKGLAYTKDFGFSWNNLSIPEVKQRFAAIYFNKNREGIIGSLWNYLAYTDNNCASWRILPTPLDQKKYQKTNRESRPEFYAVAITGNYIIVKQEEFIFYSRKDSIDWKWLPEYTNFYTDAVNSAFFFEKKSGSIVRTDTNLNPIYVYDNIVSGFDYKCKNGSLFIVSKDKVQKLAPDNQIESAIFEAKASSVLKPSVIGYTRQAMIGVLNNKAYKQIDFQGNWELMFDFPRRVEEIKLSLVDEKLIVYNRDDDSLFYFDLTGTEVKRKLKKKMFDEFSKVGIQKVVFGAGSSGCFHSFSDELIYTYQNGSFGDEIEISSGSSHKWNLPDNEEVVDASIVSEFIKSIPKLFDSSNWASIIDLEFSQKEYEKCKQDILEFKQSLEGKETITKNEGKSFYLSENNIDFDRLLNLVDSIKTLDKVRLNKLLFNLNEMISTTSNWKQVKFVNNRNETLTIMSIFYDPNAFYFPWKVSLNGYSTLTTNMDINRFLQRVYPAFISSEDRVRVLHMLVKHIY